MVKFREISHFKLITISFLSAFEEHLFAYNYNRRQSYVIIIQVTIVSATGLRAADFGGKSDPFAVVELDNLSYETATQNKTLEPRWDETFVFNVRDISDILYVTVYDKDILGVSKLLRGTCGWSQELQNRLHIAYGMFLDLRVTKLGFAVLAFKKCWIFELNYQLP